MPGWSILRAAACEHRTPIVAALLILLLNVLFSSPPARGEVRVISASGEYRMGDRDTREDAIRLATESAKRNALEQVATYLESITVVDGMDITRDEIRTYTAGLVLVIDQQTSTALDGDAIVIKTDLLAQVDTEEVGHAIAALRENEDARQQLAALKQENEQLLQQLDSANQALAQASTADQVQQAAQERQDILNRVQSNAMVSQAWTDWVIVSPVVYPYPWVGLAQTQALLNVARGLYPRSPHVIVAQQVITTAQPPTLPQPQVPPAQGSAPHIPPGHPTGSNLGAQGAPRTLNEINHATPTAPPQIGNQPHAAAPSAQQQFRNSTRMQQFLQQNGGFGQPPASALRETPSGQPPVARRLPPTINQIHPPMLHQVPRVPYNIAPRSHGGGGGFRGGGGGRGGGRGR